MIRNRIFDVLALLTVTTVVGGSANADCIGPGGIKYSTGARACINGQIMVCSGTSWDSTGQPCRAEDDGSVAHTESDTETITADGAIDSASLSSERNICDPRSSVCEVVSGYVNNKDSSRRMIVTVRIQELPSASNPSPQPSDRNFTVQPGSRAYVGPLEYRHSRGSQSWSHTIRGARWLDAKPTALPVSAPPREFLSAASESGAATGVADDAAKKAVRAHYTYIGVYTFPYQLNVENTDNHRTISVVLSVPNERNPLQPTIHRVTVPPRQFRSICYVRWPNSARVIDAAFQ